LPQQPTSPRYTTEEACIAAGHDYCLRYRRANGDVYWIGVDEEPEFTTDVTTDAATEKKRQTDPEWTYYDTESICLAAGWDYCRSYAVDVGVTKWVGFKGEQPPQSPKYSTEEECLAAGHSTCLRVRRANGSVYWLGVDYDDEE